MLRLPAVSPRYLGFAYFGYILHRSGPMLFEIEVTLMGCRGFRTSGLSRVPRIPEPGGHISGVVRMRNLTLLQGNVGLRRSLKSRCQAIATLAICQDLQLLSRLVMPRKVPSTYLPHVRPRHRLDQDHPPSCPSPRQSLSFGWNL